MTLTLKPGVIVSQQVIIAASLVNVADQLGLAEVVITSGRDGSHMANSLHYRDRALDFRTHHLADAAKHAFIALLKTKLGPDYDVILEGLGTPNEHGHAEYDPK